MRTLTRRMPRGIDGEMKLNIASRGGPAWVMSGMPEGRLANEAGQLDLHERGVGLPLLRLAPGLRGGGSQALIGMDAGAHPYENDEGSNDRDEQRTDESNHRSHSPCGAEALPRGPAPGNPAGRC